MSSVHMQACKGCAQKHADVCGICTMLCMLMQTSMCVHGALLYANVCLPAALPMDGNAQVFVQVHACTCMQLCCEHTHILSAHKCASSSAVCRHIVLCVHMHLAVLCMHSVPALRVLPRW